MRALIAIPHFFRADGDRHRHDSGRPGARAARARALGRTIARLHELFGPRHYVARHQVQGLTAEANPFAIDLDIAVVTVADHHLLGELGDAARLARHVQVDGDPRLLGFHCHRLLADQAGRHDWYGFLEDDILIEDPLFFLKLAYFNRHFPQRDMPPPLLLPQRYETPDDVEGATLGPERFYPDFQLSSTPLAPGPTIAVPLFDQIFHLEPCYHPHAGCFFLDGTQLETVARSPLFGNPSEVWVTPLDTAATLAVWRTFTIYKPALRSCSLLEVRHQRPIMLGQVRPREDGTLTWR